MPINYEVDAAGRAGAELRVARRDMRLVCTGPAARLGLLLPHLTTTTTRSPSTGQPVTVRVQYLLPLWLAAGTLVANDVYEDIISRRDSNCFFSLLCCFVPAQLTYIVVAFFHFGADARISEWEISSSPADLDLPSFVS